MSVRVSAVIISHGEPQWLRKTLVALKNQTRQVDEIIGVDSSEGVDCLRVFDEMGVAAVVRRKSNNFSDLVSAGIGRAESFFSSSKFAGDPLDPTNALPNLGAGANATGATEATVATQATNKGWYWLLHDDSAPNPDALEKLLAAADLSPSVALLGPKQVDTERGDFIVQQGLTLTKLGSIFSLVSDELDQGQHDSTDDVLSVGSAGALIRADVYRRLQGFDRHAPNFASDIDFSIRARLSGFRVVVVPEAKIAHALLSTNGLRDRKWLQGSPATARRRAEIHLQLAYLPAALVWLYAAVLPLNGLLRAGVRLAAKTPELVFSEIDAAFWGFFSLPMRLLSRRRVDLNRDIKMRSLWPLRASWSMVRNRRRTLQAAIVEIDPTSEISASSLEARAKSFASSGGWFFASALAVSSWQFWPTNTAIVGGGFAPLAPNWFALAERAGSSFQLQGFGLAAPSDPFNWVLAAIGALGVASPSLGLAWFIFLARSAAFAGAWHFFKLFTTRTWLRNLLALAYALWPSALTSQFEGRVGAIIVATALPWLGFACAKLVASVKTRALTKRGSGQLSWLGVSSILLAIVAISAPSTGVMLALGWLILIFANIRPAKYLIWLPILTLILVAPYVWFLVAGLGHPLAVFADPALPVESTKQAFWQVALGALSSQEHSGLQLVALWPALVLALATLAWFSNRPLLGFALTGFTVLADVVGFVMQRLNFEPLGVHGSAAATSVFAALCALAAAALGVELLAGMSRFTAGALGWFTAVALIAGSISFFGFSSSLGVAPSSSISFSDGRTVPAILAAEASQGVKLRVLELKQLDADHFDGRVANANSLYLEANSTAYRFALAKTGDAFRELDALVANLVSANGSKLTAGFQSAHIGYVLVTDSSAVDLGAALNSVPELESVGQTEFGWLWRVKNANPISTGSARQNQTWSFTKALQTSVIVVFALLAIPGSRRRRPKNLGSVFGDDSEDSEQGGQLR